MSQHVSTNQSEYTNKYIASLLHPFWDSICRVWFSKTSWACFVYSRPAPLTNLISNWSQLSEMYCGMSFSTSPFILSILNSIDLWQFLDGFLTQDFLRVFFFTSTYIGFLESPAGIWSRERHTLSWENCQLQNGEFNKNDPLVWAVCLFT